MGGKTGGGKAPHHRGTHQARAKRITTQAYANPDTRCWRCGHTLEHVQAQHPHRRVTWTAGHVIDSQVGGELKAECSPCNYGAGARLTNERRKGTDLTW